MLGTNAALQLSKFDVPCRNGFRLPYLLLSLPCHVTPLSRLP